MPVIGIDQVPRNLQRPSFWSDLGYGAGSLQRAILLALVGGGAGGRIGQVPTQPTPKNPGQLTFPSGATTRTSPLEMAQIQQMGGVPTQQGITPLQPGGVTYQQPTRWGMLPNLERPKSQAEIEKLQQDIALNKQLGGYYDAAAQSLNQPSTPTTKGFYQPGDILERRGKRWKIVGLDTDGMPLVDPF